MSRHPLKVFGFQSPDLLGEIIPVSGSVQGFQQSDLNGLIQRCFEIGKELDQALVLGPAQFDLRNGISSELR